MPNWAVVEESTNRVVQWITSSPLDPDYPVSPGQFAVKNPDVSAVADLELRYWKHENGVIRGMTEEERKAVDDEATEETRNQIRFMSKDSITGFSDSALAFRALADVLIAEINTLRQRMTPPLEVIEMDDFMGAVYARIDSIEVEE